LGGGTNFLARQESLALYPPAENGQGPNAHFDRRMNYWDVPGMTYRATVSSLVVAVRVSGRCDLNTSETDKYAQDQKRSQKRTRWICAHYRTPIFRQLQPAWGDSTSFRCGSLYPVSATV